MQSPKGKINQADVDQWLHNAFIFSVPALLVLLASADKMIPMQSQYGVLALYGVNLVADLVRKYYAGEVAKHDPIAVAVESEVPASK